MRALNIITAFILFMIATSAAKAQTAQWDHKDWQAQRFDNNCVVTTVAQLTKSSLSIRVDDGGFNGEVEYFGWPGDDDQYFMEPTDFIVLTIDGEESWLGEEFGVVRSGWLRNRNNIAAALTGGFTQEFIDTAKRRSDVRFFRGPDGGGEWVALDQFSFSGFTAVWGKVAEWCGFNPNALPAS